MCPRRDKLNTKPSSSKRDERETRQQEKKTREKKTYLRKDENASAFNTQLRTFNLQLRDIIGDGNCLFRSFADQMDGDQHRHAYYRRKICDYMSVNRVDFEPFIVDQPFDSFLRSLSENGTYGGNECVVAFSRLFDAKICIHQLNQPVWIVCFSDPPKHEIHISYHNYEHYSSVRKLGDHTSASANIRQLMTTCDATSLNEKKKNTTNEASTGACALDPPALFDEHDVEFIHSQLPNPVDRQLIRDTLTDNYGDIDGTIAYLLALDVPPFSEPAVPQESIDKIMSITGIYDVDLIQQSCMHHDLNVDSTIEALLKLTTEDDKAAEFVSEEESDKEQTTTTTTTTKTNSKLRPASSRQVRLDKKRAKKQRAVDKHRTQIAAAAGKTPTKSTEAKSEAAANNEQANAPPTNMEFISI